MRRVRASLYCSGTIPRAPTTWKIPTHNQKPMSERDFFRGQSPGTPPASLSPPPSPLPPTRPASVMRAREERERIASLRAQPWRQEAGRPAPPTRLYFPYRDQLLREESTLIRRVPSEQRDIRSARPPPLSFLPAEVAGSMTSTAMRFLARSPPRQLDRRQPPIVPLRQCQTRNEYSSQDTVLPGLSSWTTSQLVPSVPPLPGRHHTTRHGALMNLASPAFASDSNAFRPGHGPVRDDRSLGRHRPTQIDSDSRIFDASSGRSRQAAVANRSEATKTPLANRPLVERARAAEHLPATAREPQVSPGERAAAGLGNASSTARPLEGINRSAKRPISATFLPSTSAEEEISTSQSNATETAKKAKKKRTPRVCTISRCDKLVVDHGVCIRHGGGKRCNVDGCTCRAQNKGLCWKHGGFTICRVDGCDKRAKSRGMCWSHGGGTQCQTDGCEKVAVSRGRCWAHGGGKRCKVPECQKPAASRLDDFCSEHHSKSRPLEPREQGNDSSEYETKQSLR